MCSTLHCSKESISYVISSPLWQRSCLFFLTVLYLLLTLHSACKVSPLSWDLCSKHCRSVFPLIVSELIPKHRLYLSSKSTWAINVVEISWASLLSTVLKCLKWIDRDLAQFGGKSGHGFTSLIQSGTRSWFIFKSVNLNSDYFSSAYHYHHPWFFWLYVCLFFAFSDPWKYISVPGVKFLLSPSWNRNGHYWIFSPSLCHGVNLHREKEKGNVEKRYFKVRWLTLLSQVVWKR